jgi:hypothetical protein
MRKMFLITAALVALSGHAFAADMPVKATPPISFLNGYPYGSSGFIVGIYTEGGGGSVTGSVPGVGSASLTETQAGVGGTVGYVWGQRNVPYAISLEGDFGFNNFNGNSAGFSLTGPASFEQRVVAFTPLSSIVSQIPWLASLTNQVPPFLPLQPGVTASNLQLGIMAGIHENDISPNFPGLAANKEWRVAPMVGLVSMEQLSNGLALRTYVKTIFPSDKSVCVGPISNACGAVGQQVVAGASFIF